MRIRLDRPAGTHYQHAFRRNDEWQDHILRTQVTADLITWLHPHSVIDPAAGDGSIVAAAHGRRALDRAEMGDLSLPNCQYMRTLIGTTLPEWTIVWERRAEETLAIDDHFDVCVLTEFLEHVPDPVDILRRARSSADYLVASSPLWTKSTDDLNPEHLWQFDAAGYQELLFEGGWNGVSRVDLTFPGNIYNFQIWVAK